MLEPRRLPICGVYDSVDGMPYGYVKIGSEEEDNQQYEQTNSVLSAAHIIVTADLRRRQR